MGVSPWDMLPHEVLHLVWQFRRRLMAIDLLERERVTYTISRRVWPGGVDPRRPHLPRTLRHVNAWLPTDETSSSSTWVDEVCDLHVLFDARCQVCHVTFPTMHPSAPGRFCSLACYEHV